MNLKTGLIKPKVETFDECTKCGECCLSLTENNIFTIPLTRKDARRLKSNAKFKELREAGKIEITKGNYDPFYPYDLVAEGYCPFLNLEIKRCIIYEDRPSNCREFTCYD